LEVTTLKTKMPVRHEWRSEKAVQLPGRARPTFVKIVLAMQEPASDEGAGAMGKGAKEKGCLRSQHEVRAKEKGCFVSVTSSHLNLVSVVNIENWTIVACGYLSCALQEACTPHPSQIMGIPIRLWLGIYK
jgi:hypothetical protein